LERLALHTEIWLSRLEQADQSTEVRSKCLDQLLEINEDVSLRENTVAQKS
jgi:hypothetical protein